MVRQLRTVLPPGWKAALLAVDGARIGDIAGQLRQAPRETTHLVISIGGNDVLGHLPVLHDTANSIAGALLRLAEIREGFAHEYRAMFDQVLGRRLPAALCTIYEPHFPDAQLQRAGVAALPLFNDVITREAFARGLPVIDLRLICDRDEDYANPIEPSAKGGDKIAAAIAHMLAEHAFVAERSRVFVR